MAKQTSTPEAPQKQTGLVCPHCKGFIPEPVVNTLKLKVSWYLDGKDPKKGAQPIKVIRYPETPKIGTKLTFKDSVYEIVRLDDTNAGEAAGYLKQLTQGKYKPLKTRIQDPKETYKNDDDNDDIE